MQQHSDWSLERNYVLFVYQTEEPETLPFIRMLKERSIVLDFEGFRHQKITFIVKELAITTSDYSDSLIFLPPVNFNSLPKSEQKAYNWLKMFCTDFIGIAVIIYT